MRWKGCARRYLTDRFHIYPHFPWIYLPVTHRHTAQEICLRKSYFQRERRRILGHCTKNNQELMSVVISVVSFLIKKFKRLQILWISGSQTFLFFLACDPLKQCICDILLVVAHCLCSRNVFFLVLVLLKILWPRLLRSRFICVPLPSCKPV